MQGYCQQCAQVRDMDHVVETRVANRTVDAGGRAGDRKAYRGECTVCGAVILRVSSEMCVDGAEQPR